MKDRILNVSANIRSIEKVMDFIEESLKDYKTNDKLKNTYMLVSEELFTKIAEDAAGEKREVMVRITKDISGICDISFSFPGDPFEIKAMGNEDIGGAMLSHYADAIRYKYVNGYNTVSVILGTERTMTTIYSAIAVGAAMLLMFILEATGVPQARVMDFVAEYIHPIENMFIKAASLLAPPVLFFSIANSILRYSSVKDRYPGMKKLFFGFTSTTILAMLVGIGVCVGLKQPLNSNFGYSAYYKVDIPEGGTFFGLLDSLSSIVPDNLLEPFITSNTVQLMFLALLAGAALGSIGKYSEKYKDTLDNICGIFYRMLGIVFNIVPFIIFLSAVDSIAFNGFAIIPLYLKVILIILLAMAIQLLVYVCILKAYKIAIRSFFRKVKSTLYENFRIGSAESAVPLTIKNCQKQFRMSGKFLNVAIPLGATNNMDGSVICLAVTTFLYVYAVGIDLAPMQLLSLGILSVILSLGAPNQPGAYTLAMAILLPQFGVSANLVTDIIIYETLLSRLLAAFNVLGDVVICLAVTKNGKQKIL